jgi:predicted ATPase
VCKPLLRVLAGQRQAIPPLWLMRPFGERYPPLQLTEAVQKQRTMGVLEEQLVQLSRRGAVLVLFEDTHWFDPTSLELMDRIVRRVVNLPALIIVTYRPEFTAPWLDLGHATMLIVEQIATKSQSVPLFIEEITRAILESGDLEEVGERQRRVL